MGKELDWNCFGKISTYGDEGGTKGVFFIKNAEGKKLIMVKNHSHIRWQDTRAKVEKYKDKCVEVATSHGCDPEKWFCDIRPCDSESCAGESCDC